jgi:hypothetical protein
MLRQEDAVHIMGDSGKTAPDEASDDALARSETALRVANEKKIQDAKLEASEPSPEAEPSKATVNPDG